MNHNSPTQDKLLMCENEFLSRVLAASAGETELRWGVFNNIVTTLSEILDQMGEAQRKLIHELD